MKTKKMQTKSMKTTLFVRKAIDEDHVLKLAELIQGDVKLPRIKVSPDDEVIDGRHRKEAYEFLGIKEVEVEVELVKDEIDLITKAYRANEGGSLPPRREDTEHTVVLLLNRGVAKKQIGDVLGLPSSLARKYVTEIQHKVDRAKLQRAVDAVADGGITAAKAAEQYEVDPDKLKGALSGGRRKAKNGVQEVQRNMTRLFKSVSQRNAAACRTMIEKFEDGDVTAKQVKDFFQQMKKLQQQSRRSVVGWEDRFMASIGEKTSAQRKADAKEKEE